MKNVTTAIDEGVREFGEKFCDEVKDINGNLAYIELKYIGDAEEIESFLTHFAKKIALAALQDGRDEAVDYIKKHIEFYENYDGYPPTPVGDPQERYLVDSETLDEARQSHENIAKLKEPLT